MISKLEPRNFGAIFSDTFRIYGRNFLRIIAITAIVEVFLGVLGYILFEVLAPQAFTSVLEIESLVPLVLMVAIILVASILTSPLMSGALIHAISEQHFQQGIGIGQAYRFSFRRWPAMIGASILAFLAIAAMAITIIGFLAAIYFIVCWAFMLQSALLERCGPTAALSRSFALVRRNWWRVFGIMLVIWIISMLVYFILGTIPIIGSIIGGILSTPIVVTAATLLYYDLRVRKEGYSLEALAQELNIKTDSDIA